MDRFEKERESRRTSLEVMKEKGRGGAIGKGKATGGVNKDKVRNTEHGQGNERQGQKLEQPPLVYVTQGDIIRRPAAIPNIAQCALRRGGPGARR